MNVNYEKNIDLLLSNISSETQNLTFDKFGNYNSLKDKLLKLCQSQDKFVKAITNNISCDEISSQITLNGFYVKRNAFDASLVKLSKKFLLKRFVSNFLNDSTFGNYDCKDLYLIHSIHFIFDYINKLNIFNNVFFNCNNIQLSTSPADPNKIWAVDTLEYHSDTAVPNLKIFGALNRHNALTGQYSFIDVNTLGASRLNLISLASWIAIEIFPSTPFNNSLTEKFGRSLLRTIFNDDFFLEYLFIDYDSAKKINFDLNPGDIVLSYNIYPHARILGNVGWSNRRIFFHPLPYPRVVI